MAITELFKQVLCFFVDGSSGHLAYFDQTSRDEGYAGGIETEPADMVSSHQIKRFFKAFAWTRVFLFRRLLQTLFLWRLQIGQPDVIELIETVTRLLQSNVSLSIISWPENLTIQWRFSSISDKISNFLCGLESKSPV